MRDFLQSTMIGRRFVSPNITVETKNLRMSFIRKVLERNSNPVVITDELGTLTKFTIYSLWTIVAFTSDQSFCSQYQSDLLRSDVGCRWVLMDVSYSNVS